MKDINTLQDMLIRHEGLRLKAYFCPRGKITVGVGRNIEDHGISEAEAHYLLANDIKRCLKEAQSFPWFNKLNEPRQMVIVSMLFNLGKKRFLEFKQMIEALGNGDFRAAAREMLSSLWAKQVGKRSVELAAIMKTGSFE